MKRFAGLITVMLVCGLASALWAQDVQAPLPLSSFEPGQPTFSGQGVVVQNPEFATDGTHVLKLENQADEFVNFEITDRAVLSKFRDYVLLRIDIYNPQDQPVRFSVKATDAQSKDYGSRYNNDYNVAPPGKSTWELNLTGLTRSNAKNFAERLPMDLSTLNLVSLFFQSPGGKTVLYLDNVRLEGSGLPKVEGLRAYDFGPASSPVYAGFQQVSEKHQYTPESGLGFVRVARHDNVYIPDDLTSDFVAGDFKVNLPNGKYEINLCMDHFGIWGTYPNFTERTLIINGKEVLRETRTPEQFLDMYYMHEMNEDLPGQDWWDKFIAPRNVIRTFSVEVTDGVLSIEPRGTNHHARSISFVVIYPESQLEAGRNWMKVLQEKRKDRFNSSLVVHVPTETNPEPQASAEDRARGFIPFARHTEVDVAVNTRPAADEVHAAVRIMAARGEREHGQIGLYVLEDLKGVTVRPSELKGPDGKTIDASAVQVRMIRNFLKRSGRAMLADLQPRILLNVDSLDLTKGITRGLWVTVTVPTDAAPGTYTGTVRVGTTDKYADVPIELTVFPFVLKRDAADITLSVTGAQVGGWSYWREGLEDRYWKMAELVMKDHAEHGMNAVTGGPGARLQKIENGKAVIDYADADRWLALAVKYGLTRPGDSYQGLDVTGLPRQRGPKAHEEVEQTAREQWGVSFSDLVRIVYSDVEQHAKEKNWPVRSYYLLDEPRAYWGNVESCWKILQMCVEAAPGTRFSGYYTPGDGRDDYFLKMPVNISHYTARAAELTRSGGTELWDYDGQGARHNIGRWAFQASKNGLSGYLRNGYMYVCSDPYFDFSDDEASWCVVYPGRNGINSTTAWERTAQGANDFYYLSMLDDLIKQARDAGKAKAQADAAEAYIQQTLSTIDLEQRSTARLSPAQYDQFKRTLATHIAALSEALGQ